MDEMKAKKQGNSVMVEIPEKFNVPNGQEFYITKEINGTISLTPIVKDYFKSVEPGGFIDEEDSLAKNFKADELE